MAATRQQSSLGWYLERIKHTPLLSAQEEKQLARRIREHSDPIARQQMIRANLLLVVKIAKQFSSTGMTLNDLVAEGNLGLMRAVEDFDPDQDVRFSTYASWWIKQAIKRALINADQPIHIPDYLSKLIRKWRRTSRNLASELGREPTIAEIARALNISRRKAEIVQQGLTALRAPSQIGPAEPNALEEMLADENILAPDQRLLDESIGPLIENVLDRLDPRSREIVILRYGLDGHPQGPRTYKEIGQIVGLTRERVRQIERQAMDTLRSTAGDLI
jgi:RNA polymerase primary sigma factor